MVRKNGTIMAYQPLAEIYNVQCVLHEIARFPLEFSSWNFTLNPFGGERAAVLGWSASMHRGCHAQWFRQAVAAHIGTKIQ